MSPRNRTLQNNRDCFGHSFFKCLFMILAVMTILTAAPVAAENTLIRFYQKHISAVDSDRCQMHPSCSKYASQAIEKHGLFMGWIMACDRLTRCGRDEVALSQKIVIQNKIHTLDTVESNDFWWFSPEKHQ